MAAALLINYPLSDPEATLRRPWRADGRRAPSYALTLLNLNSKATKLFGLGSPSVMIQAVFASLSLAWPV